METITVNCGVQVLGGPQISIPPQKIEVEAYEKFAFTIGNDPKTKQKIDPPKPFDLGKDISFLLIKSSLDGAIGTDAPKLTYQFKDGKELVLDRPHFYVGKSNVSILGDDLKELKLTFTPSPSPPPPTDPTKPADKPIDFVTVEILVGRDIP
jgi:hypothetical protein